MSFESPSNNESVRDKLIELLKTRGFDDAEAKQAFFEWARVQEHQVEIAGTVEARVLYQIECADIYIDAGYVEDGIVSLEDSLIIASQEGLRELEERIQDKLSSL